MTYVRRLIVGCAVAALAAGSAAAGYYDPAKPVLELTGTTKLSALPHDVFRGRWNDFVSIAIPDSKEESRKAALAEKAKLLAKGNLTPAERIQLGILHMRLREMDSGLMHLKQAYDRNRGDFWAITALGTAFQQMGQFAEAESYLAVAVDRDVKPTPAELPKDIVAVEAAQRKLVRLRLVEQSRRPGGRPAPPEDVDRLFDVDFVNEAGNYEPGNLAAAQKAKLPEDAVAIVQQLLIWSPDDRLYWLLGELYAAQGDIDAALAVFNECVDSRGLAAAKLRQHRQAVMEAIGARAEAAKEQDFWSLWEHWRIAAFIAGPLLLLLIVLQWRQLRRRRRRQK